MNGGVLVIVDGWGASAGTDGDAIDTAQTPRIDQLESTWGVGYLEAAGEAVGLLPGTVGNSEVGHIIIGAGRPIPYESLLLARMAEDGTLRRHKRLTETCRRAVLEGATVHLAGLCSDGGIHADVRYVTELLAVTRSVGVQRVRLHAFTDGRDVAVGTAGRYLSLLDSMLDLDNDEAIATVCGRGFALDKSGDHTLTDPVVQLMAQGKGYRADLHSLDLAPAGASEEWVLPTVTATEQGKPPYSGIDPGDVIIFWNFRSDRIQQLVDALLDQLEQDEKPVKALSLARYDTQRPVETVISRPDASGGLGQVLPANERHTSRLAEQEKFEHVTYYINGRAPADPRTESHVKVPATSPRDYIREPHMSTHELVIETSAAIKQAQTDLVICNVSNMDVVGHTGDFGATVLAAEQADTAIGSIVDAARDASKWTILVGDHGNAEQMYVPDTRRPYGGHTTNPVPLIIVPGSGLRPYEIHREGTLADIAPTILHLLSLATPDYMTGTSLIDEDLYQDLDCEQ